MIKQKKFVQKTIIFFTFAQNFRKMTTLYYDVIVIGGGHAGCEAAHAAARMGARTCLVTMDMNKIAQMSCNPAVGGIAKGQIVREIDALGGGMGLVTDATAIQFRMLNRSKGPAMWSPRSQCDRAKFIWKWREVLDHTDNLDIWQDQVTELICNHFDSNESRTHLEGVRTIWGCELRAPSVVVTAGTFLNGLMHVGRNMVPGGRCAEPAALKLTENINALGISSARMKTGTPVRIDKRSVHFEDMERQDGDDIIDSNMSNMQFSFIGEQRALPQLPCWTTTTNARVHEILRSGLADSPLFNGQIQSTGPRYCPSIETKLVTFADKDSHPLFLEPEGTDTNEMYLNGFSSSMPMDIQIEALKQIPAFRDLKVYRPGYAIEYDYFDPTQLSHSLMSKKVDGLFFAGQVNGTTGYEEAGGQGLVAGVNAAIYAGNLGTSPALQTTTSGQAPFILHRDEAYIGVLIDDLVMKGVDEPYRMFTSRAEYRILLRQDNADARLTEKSYNMGLADAHRLNIWKTKKENIDAIMTYCQNNSIKPNDVNSYLQSIGSAAIKGSTKLIDLISRPNVTISDMLRIDSNLAGIASNREAMEEAEILIKYGGYIRREREYADKMHRLENIKLKGHFDYSEIQSLSTEARQKLNARQPETLAQASRIPGVSPSDINVLLVLMGR